MATEILRADTDYALRALLELAGADKPLPCAAIARACGIPQSFAHKILQKLARAGLVTSAAGRSGGFSIARRPEDISLAEVTQVMQGPMAIRRCLIDPKKCARDGRCSISSRLRRFQEELAAFLYQTSLADVLPDGPGDAASRRSPKSGRSAGRSRSVTK